MRSPAAAPPRPIDAPKRLVTNGVYRYSRNPIYVAVLIALAGWASLFQSPLLLVYGVALFALYSFFVQRHEEPHLAREFGEEFTAYKATQPAAGSPAFIAENAPNQSSAVVSSISQSTTASSACCSVAPLRRWDS